MKKHMKLVEIELHDDKLDGSMNGKTYVLHLRMDEAAGEEEIKTVIEEDYGFDMKNMWKIKEVRSLNL